MLLGDGFPGQRLRVLPRPVVDAALQRPPTSGLLVTDAGYFPRAANHGRSRSHGALETVLIVCTDGAGVVRAGDRTASMTAGRVCVLPPGTPHAYWASPDDPWTIWWMHVAGRHVGEFTGTLVDAASGGAVVTLHDVYRATSVIDDAITFLEHDETTASLISAAGAGWSLLAQIAADAVAGTRGRSEPVRQAQEHLRRHVDKPVDVAALARTAGLSTSHFSALFRAATGGGVVEYAKRHRMARARELLITTRAPVNQVAAAVGYGDAFYFSRQFRTVHGCSPSQYREQRAHGTPFDHSAVEDGSADR